MNGLEQPPIKHLINQLQLKKVSLIQQEPRALLNLESYFEEIRQLTQIAQQTLKKKFKNEILKYHEKATELIQFLSSKTILENQNQEQIAEQFLNMNIYDQPVVSISNMKKVIEHAFPLNISNKKPSSFKKMLQKFLQQEQGLTNEEKDQSEKVIEKLQSQRDYYQRRELQLRNKLNQVQVNLKKKGVNIKQMSRSYLEDKCSKWALERLTEQKKILVERIGEASQQILKLNSDIGELQHQIRRLNGAISDYNGKSMVGTSTIKTYSMVLDEKVLENEERKSKQEELQSRNEQLMIKITQCMTQMEQLREINKEMQSKLEEAQQKFSQCINTIETLKQNNQYLNSDYELSLKKKAIFQQENKQLQKENLKLNEKISENQREYQQMIFELQQKQKDVIEKVKQIQLSKQTELTKYEEKLQILNEEKVNYIKTIEQIAAKKGQQINYKSLLNEQIARLHRQNANLARQLELKEQKLFDSLATNQQMESNLTLLQRKMDQNKKENTRLKKQNKQLDKNIGQLQKQLNSNSQIQGKMAQFEQNYYTILSEFTKYKQDSERKTGMYDKLIVQLKQKFEYELNILQNEQNKGKTKRSGQKIEQVKHYIEENATIARKNALIKQLKEQIKQLKDKEPKSTHKKTYMGTIQESATKISQDVFKLGTNIMEERIRTLLTEKQLLQQSIREMSDKIAKEQNMRKCAQADLQKERILNSQLKSKQKQEVNAQINTKTLKKKQQKLLRVQSQLKIVKTSYKNLQDQKNKLDSQIENKRSLVAGLKKECKEKQDTIKQISTQLSLAQDQLEKLRRNTRQINKKESLFKDIKERKQQVNQENSSLKKTVESLEERIKLLTKQLAKKDESLKQRKNQQQKQLKVKEDLRLKQALQKVSTQKDQIRKLKADVNRKDELYKNVQNEKKQLEEVIFLRDQDVEKAKRESELLRKKIQGSNHTNKKEQIRKELLIKLIKKIFSICVNTQKQSTSRINRESTHYYSAQTVSPQIKITQTPVPSHMKSQSLCQGLKILDLRPEDLDGLLGQTTTVQSRVTNPHYSETSWSMVSPIVCKNKESQKKQDLVSGLQRLQNLLKQKQFESYEIERLFKNVLGVQ